MAERLGQPDGVLIVDDTGFVKKGTVSAGVQRQYSGTAGRTENCQIGVFAAYAYASAKGRALVDRELYLPTSWTEDPDRCRAARIPEDKSFATKPELARAMIRRALDSPLPIAWVSADAAYGQEWHFRRMLEEAGVGYVLAVPKSQQVKSPAGSRRIDHVLTGAPAEAWERISCGNGAKGPRVYDWAAAKLPAIDGSDPTHDRWVLARRSLTRPEEIAYYLAFAQADVTVSELVRVAGARWAIEECFQAASVLRALEAFLDLPAACRGPLAPLPQESRCHALSGAWPMRWSMRGPWTCWDLGTATTWPRPASSRKRRKWESCP
ncbi:SRSO17 transposase [Streptomyces sp. TE33382]